MPGLSGSFTLDLSESKYILSSGQGGAVASLGSSSAEKSLRNVKLFHGIIMSLGWGIFMPVSTLAARYLRSSRSSWLNEHIILTKVGAAGSISFIVVAFAAGPTSASTHEPQTDWRHIWNGCPSGNTLRKSFQTGNQS